MGRAGRVAITVDAGGAEHRKAIRTQELFARRVIPHSRAVDVPEPVATTA